MSAIVVPVVCGIARGVWWLAGTSTRISLNTITFSVSTATAVVRIYKTIEHTVDVIIVLQYVLGKHSEKKNK